MKRVLLVVLLCGCDLYQHPPFPAGPDAPVSPPAMPTNDLDVLFVITDDASTLDKQTELAHDFPAFVAALDALPAGRPNLHVGAVSTTVDIGAPGFANGSQGCPSPDPWGNGLLQNGGNLGCTGASPEPYIIDVSNGSGGRVTNYAGSLAGAMACIGQVGATGCGFTAPLEAMKRALDGTNPQNAGFLRDGAALLVVIVEDRDDCSAQPGLFELSGEPPGSLRCAQYGYACDQPISDTQPGTYTGCVARTDSPYLYDPASYAAFLATLENPQNTAVAVIAGDPSTTIQIGALSLPSGAQAFAVQPSCTATINGNPAIAQPADRLVAFEHGLPNAAFFTVCTSDYSPAFAGIASLAAVAMSR